MPVADYRMGSAVYLSLLIHGWGHLQFAVNGKMTNLEHVGSILQYRSDPLVMSIIILRAFDRWLLNLLFVAATILHLLCSLHCLFRDHMIQNRCCRAWWERQ